MKGAKFNTRLLVLYRNNPDFRLILLFQENSQTFIDEYSKRHARMQQFFSDLEQEAIQLDNMKRGASISTVVGSSVGVAGGVLSIVGLALAPVTAGVSLILTLTGVGLGVTSGVNSLVTGITEVAVNSLRGKSANNIFMKFMEDMQEFMQLLEKVAESNIPAHELRGLSKKEIALEVVKVGGRVSAIGKGIDSIVDGASAVKVLQSEEVAARAVGVIRQAKTARNIPNMAADLPDIGQLAKGTPLALSKAARSGFIALNAFFIGLDVFFIFKEGMSLAKGRKNELAQLIRSRADLWRSELNSWKSIYDSLCKEIGKLSESEKILHMYFRPNVVLNLSEVE